MPSEEAFHVLYYTLRTRIDAFIASCRVVGLFSPAEVPEQVQECDGRKDLVRLLQVREGIVHDIVDLVQKMPKPLVAAISSGDASSIVAILETASGSRHSSFGRAMLIASLPMLCLDLLTSFGADMHFAVDNLADELSRLGSARGGSMLQAVLLYMRTMEAWLALNPTLENYIGDGESFFRLLCFFVSVSNKLGGRSIGSVWTKTEVWL